MGGSVLNDMEIVVIVSDTTGSDTLAQLVSKIRLHIS